MFYAHRSDRFKFIMCTNGRCGSTLLKRWYLGIHGRDLPIPGDHTSVHNALPYEDEDLHVARDGFNDHPYFKFIVVRNPWERLVSFFKVWVVSNQSNHESLGRDCSFEKMIDQLEKEGPKDAHTTQQLYGLDGLKFDKVVYLDDVKSGMKDVCGACNVSFDESQFSERIFESPLINGRSTKDIHKATGHEIIERDYWPEWRRFYTERLRDRVSKIYAKDIETFGYQWSSLDGEVEHPRPEPASIASESAKKTSDPSKKSSRRRRSSLR